MVEKRCNLQNATNTLLLVPRLVFVCGLFCLFVKEWEILLRHTNGRVSMFCVITRTQSILLRHHICRFNSAEKIVHFVASSHICHPTSLRHHGVVPSERKKFATAASWGVNRFERDFPRGVNRSEREKHPVGTQREMCRNE